MTDSGKSTGMHSENYIPVENSQDPGKLAVLIPTFNGGRRLKQTIDSCVNASLPPDSYEIIVVDNQSDDGSVNNLPSKDRSGAKITLIHNKTNLGRIGNWNQAVAHAEVKRFRYFTFLFVGDEWPAKSGHKQLLAEMDRCNACFALGPITIVDNEGATLYQLNRLANPNSNMRRLPSTSLLGDSIENGILLFAPIQGNIYATRKKNPLHFIETDPSQTDQRATIEYLCGSFSDVMISNEPLASWKAHPERYHMSMDHLKRANDTVGFLYKIEQLTSIKVNWSRANVNLMLGHVREALLLNRNWNDAWKIYCFYANNKNGLSYIYLFNRILTKIFKWHNRNRRY